MLPHEAKLRAISIILGSFGDDLERAKAAFRGYTPEEMQKEYGASGRTCQEILDGYKKDRAEREAVLEWVKSVA